MKVVQQPVFALYLFTVNSITLWFWRTCGNDNLRWSDNCICLL